MDWVNILLFPDFTALDAFGPVEALGSIETYRLRFVSPEGGLVAAKQGFRVQCEPVSRAASG